MFDSSGNESDIYFRIEGVSTMCQSSLDTFRLCLAKLHIASYFFFARVLYIYLGLVW
jgi:hypothetical protein